MATKNEKPVWVLVVDDDRVVADTLREGLDRAGFKTVVALTVTDAYSKISKQTFDVILTDICLGRGSGEEVIRAVRSRGSMNLHTPILVASAFLETDLVKRIRTMVNGVMVKPFSIRALIDRLRNAVPNGAEAAVIAKSAAEALTAFPDEDKVVANSAGAATPAPRAVAEADGVPAGMPLVAKKVA